MEDITGKSATMPLRHGGTLIAMRAGNEIAVEACLDDSQTSRDFIALLPVTMSMTRWGNREYYGKVLLSPAAADGRLQEGFTSGDVAYWVPGGSFALFFNDTENPDISELIVMGKITAGLGALAAMGETVDMRIEVIAVEG